MSRGAKSVTVTHDVFVGNLPPEANEKFITKHFSPYGEIQSLNIFNNKAGTGKVSFVRYFLESDADNACRANQGLEIHGKKLLIRKAKKGGASDGGGVGDIRKPPFDRSSNEGYNSPDIVPQSDLTDRRSQGSDSDLSQSADFNKEEQVFVTHVESVISLWVQTITEQAAEGLRSMTKKLAQTCPAASKVKGTPVSGKHYATQFSQDGCWYRCTVKQLHSVKGKVKVLYVDFGNMEEKAMDELVEIPQSLANVKPFAKKIILHGLAVKNDIDSQAVSADPFLAGLQFVQEKTEGRPLNARFTIPLRDNTGSYGDLYVDDCSLSEMALQRGFVRRTMLPQKGNSPRVQGANNGSPRRVTLTKSQVTNPETNRTSRNELAEYKMCLEKEKAEKDMLSFELATLKGKLKSLQAEHAATTTKIVENALEQKLINVTSLVQKVSQIRKQFPSDDNLNDCISTSLSVAMAADHVTLESISSLGRVSETLEAYTSCQQAIKACQSLEGVTDLVEKRDRRRHDLYASFQQFLDESSKMPLDDRMTKVKAVLQAIKESYSGFIHFIVNHQPNLGEAKNMYNEWRARVMAGFREVREQTDAVKQNLTTTLYQIQQLISMEDVGQEGSVNFDLDGMVKDYISALQKELTVTDVQHSNEACHMASIIHEIKRVVEEELKIIESVKCLATEFTRQKTAIEEWLNQKPDLQDIRDVRKNLRSMKSSLRHLLADKEDMDENDSGSDDERNRIETELATLRSDLQRTLLSEEQLMVKYSALAEDHFPELKLTDADLNLDLCQMYSGMLKMSRDIDHYTLEPAADQQGVYNVMFGDRPAVLKEYAVDDRIHPKKDEFLRRALRYSRISSPYLAPIEAVFFSKNQKQAFVQTQASGLPLLDFVEHEDLKPWLIQKILRCVTEGLCALHEAGLTHGALSPQYIVITEGKVAKLVVPDFSQPAADPSRCWFTTDAGLQFKAPEEDTSQAPTPSSDLFHLGLLCLWIHVPNIRLGEGEAGIPVLTELLISEDVRQVIHSLMVAQSSSRVSAREVLQAEYFSNTIPDLLHVETQAPGDTYSDYVEESDDFGVTSVVDHMRETSPTEELTAGLQSSPVLAPDSAYGVTSAVDHMRETSPTEEQMAGLQSAHIPAPDSDSALQEDHMVLEQDVCPPTLKDEQEPLISVAQDTEETATVQSPKVVYELLSEMVPELNSLNLPHNPPATADKLTSTALLSSSIPVESLSSAAGSATSEGQDPTGSASSDPIMATAGALAENLNLNLLAFTNPVDSDSVQLLEGGPDNQLPENPNTMGHFTVDQNTMDTLTSMASHLPPLDGSGDAKDTDGLSTPALALDNVTLMQNLLNLTAQHNPKNLGF